MEEKIEKIKAIDALEWFWGNICIKKCDYEGIKKLDCYEKMRKIISGFEDYLVTRGQFIYSIRVKNKVCDLANEEIREKEDSRQNEQPEHFTQSKPKKCSICGNEFIPRKSYHAYCDRCALKLYKKSMTEKERQEVEEESKIFGEPEHWFTCYECGGYFEGKPHWVLLPLGWKPFCEDCYNIPESDYDKDGVPFEEMEESERLYNYGDDDDFFEE